MEAETLQKQNLKVVPKLRFRQFESDWERRSLSAVSKIITGSTPPTNVETYYGGQRLFVSPADIQSNRFVYHTKTTLTESGFIKGRKIKKGSVLFVCIGSTIGKVGQAMEECLTNQQINALEANKENLNDFIFSLLEKNAPKVKLLAGTQAVPQINKTDFSNLKFHFPSLPEQQKIASFLSAVDKKIQQLTQKKELLETYKKGVMQKLFSQEIRFKVEDGKDFPDWEVKKIKEVSNVNPKNSEIPETFFYIDLESVDSGRLIKERRISAAEAPSRAQRNLETNDILFQTVRPYQKNNLFFGRKGDYIASTGYAQLRVKENPMFLYQLLHTEEFVREVMNRCTGTSFPAINSNDLAKIKIKVPVEKEQQKIADFLSAIDEKTEAVSQQIKKTQTFKKGLLQQMFV